jgi:predicted TIM-barrel fold metal-dependent hydrolase
MSVFDEAKIDCHCHVLDPVRFPYAPDVRYEPVAQEIGPVQQYLQVMQAYGIAHALLVAPNSGYNLDNRCLLDALALGAGKFKGVAIVPMDMGLDGLQALQAQGVVGVAFNPSLLGVDFYAGAEPLLHRMAKLDMLLSLQVEHDQLLAMRAMLERSQVKVLIDHCGRPNPRAGLSQAGFQTLLDLGRGGRTAVKLSGFQKFSLQGPPFADSRPYVEALLEAFTLDACLWASDWPFLRAPHRLDVGPLLHQLALLLPDVQDRARLLWHTPKRWLGF